MTQSPDDSISLICPACGYDLRGIPSERCPECGTSIDRSATAISTIPWVHRKTIGRVRAYWRTLILATFRIRRPADEINRPVNWGDANRFRWVTVGVAAIVPIAVFVVAVIINGGTKFLLEPLAQLSFVASSATSDIPLQADAVLPYLAGITCWVVLPIAVICWFAMISGLAAFWFGLRSRPAHQRDRAGVLSLYACGPLVWLSLAFAIEICGIMAMSDEKSPAFLHEILRHTADVVAAGGEAILIILIFLYWINQIRLLHFTLHPGRFQIVLFAAVFPFAAAGCALIAFGLFPWIVGFVWLVIDSLR